MSSEANNSSIKEVTSVTSGALERKRSFTWKIDKFAAIKANPNLFKQQFFHFEVGQKEDSMSTKWRCYFSESETDCGIFFNLEKITCPSQPELDEVCISFQLWKIKQNGDIHDDKYIVKTKTLKVKNCWGFPKFFFAEDAEYLKQVIWEDGSRLIEIDFKVYDIKPLKQDLDLNERVRIFEKNETQNFINSMTRMVEEDNKMDDLGKIKVVTKDKVEFFVNPAILSARSPVFKAMFATGKWKEGQPSEGGGSLVLDDLSGKTMKVLLHYLYGSVLLNEDWKDEDVILELTWAAGKYQLESLSEFLDKVLAILPLKSMDVIGKLALLTKRLGMKNAENGLLKKLKEEANDIDQLILDKNGALIEVPTKVNEQI